MGAPRKISRAQWLEAARLRAHDPKHWTFQRLGERYGMSAAGVWNALRREDRPPRTSPCGRPGGYGAHLAAGERACLPCMDEHAREQRERRWERGSGSVPAEQVRAVLDGLLASGWTMTQVAARSGLSLFCLYAVRRGEYEMAQLRTLRALEALSGLPGEVAA